jgi:hypothetical protein
MGPLQGVKIVEFAGIGPGPLCGMMLADLGAEVLRIDRKNPIKHYAGQKWDSYNPGRFGVLNRGKQSVTVDLKTAAGIDTALRLIERAQRCIALGWVKGGVLGERVAGFLQGERLLLQGAAKGCVGRVSQIGRVGEGEQRQRCGGSDSGGDGERACVRPQG